MSLTFNPNDRKSTLGNAYLTDAYDRKGGSNMLKAQRNVERWDWETWNGRRDFQFSNERFSSEPLYHDKKRKEKQKQKKDIVITLKTRWNVVV